MKGAYKMQNNVSTQRDFAEDQHTRWDEDHRSICTDCYSDWLDACMDMQRDAELDAMSEAYELEMAA